jgi:hypothetical protein
MSEQNLELARRLFPGSVDLVASISSPETLRAVLEPLVDPQFETVAAPGQLPLTDAGAMSADPSSRPTYYGIDGFLAGFRDWLSTWVSWTVTPEELIVVDDRRVLALIGVTARSKTHGVEMPIEAANLLTFEAGRLTRLELYFKRAHARAATGLS